MTEEEFIIANLKSCILLAQSLNNSVAEKAIKSALNQITDKALMVNL
jgi:hypothetical protein